KVTGVVPARRCTFLCGSSGLGNSSWNSARSASVSCVEKMSARTSNGAPTLAWSGRARRATATSRTFGAGMGHACTRTPIRLARSAFVLVGGGGPPPAPQRFGGERRGGGPRRGGGIGPPPVFRVPRGRWCCFVLVDCAGAPPRRERHHADIVAATRGNRLLHEI